MISSTSKVGFAGAKLAGVREGAEQPGKRLAATDFTKAWGYQFGEKLPVGSWIVDLSCIVKTLRVVGCSKVSGLYLPVDGECELMITLRGVIESPIDKRKLPITRQEKLGLKKIAPALLNRDKFVFLSDALKIMKAKQ